MVKKKFEISKLIFMGRWLQAPLYLGLMVILAVYVYRFLLSLIFLVTQTHNVDDTQIMLGVLDLVDVVMIANLLIMVIIGGYQTFVAPLRLPDEAHRPEWLDVMDAGSMKVKVALSLIGISSIHLLRTFIDPTKYSTFSVQWQVIIHVTLLVSAVSIAFTNWLLGRD